MSERILISSLSAEEIEQNFENTDFFSDIMAGLEEALAFEKSEAKAAKMTEAEITPPCIV